MKVFSWTKNALAPKFLFSVPVFVSVFLFMEMVYILGAIQDSREIALSQTIAMASSSGALFLSLFAFKFAFSERRLNSLTPLTVLSGVIVSSGLGFLFYSSASALLDSQYTAPSFPRFLAATLFTSSVLLAANGITFGLRTRHSMQMRIRAELLRMTQLENMINFELGAWETIVAKPIKLEITNSLLVDRFRTTSDALKALQESINLVVQPMSKKLRELREEFEVPEITIQSDKFDWKRIFVESLHLKNFRPTLPLVFVGLLDFPQISAKYGLFTTLLSGSTFLTVALFFSGITKFLVRNKNFSVERFLMVPVAVLGMILGLFASSRVADIETFSLPTSAFTAMFFGLFLYVYTFLRVANDQAAKTLVELDALLEDVQWKIARSREMFRQRYGSFTDVLHGEVQARISAAHIRISNASEFGADSQAFLKDQREWVLESLNLLDEAQLGTPKALAEILESIRATWYGVAKVELESNPQVLALLQSDVVCARTVNNLVPELCFNAVKHSSASAITIRLELENYRVLKLQVISNGEEQNNSQRTGSGTELLNESCISWHRTANSEGSRTEAYIPLVLMQNQLLAKGV